MAKRSKPKNTGVPSKSKPTTKEEHAAFTDEQIRRRAYEIYMSRGDAPGDPLGDWLRAKAELKAAANRT